MLQFPSVSVFYPGQHKNKSERGVFFDEAIAPLRCFKFAIAYGFYGCKLQYFFGCRAQDTQESLRNSRGIGSSDGWKR
jgi:hypothetical protein